MSVCSAVKIVAVLCVTRYRVHFSVQIFQETTFFFLFQIPSTSRNALILLCLIFFLIISPLGILIFFKEIYYFSICRLKIIAIFYVYYVCISLFRFGHFQRYLQDQTRKSTRSIKDKLFGGFNFKSAFRYFKWPPTDQISSNFSVAIF